MEYGPLSNEQYVHIDLNIATLLAIVRKIFSEGIGKLKQIQERLFRIQQVRRVRP